MVEKEKQFDFCPNCGSTNLKWLMGGMTGDQYKCVKCNYPGPALKGSMDLIRKVQGNKKGD